MPPRAPRSPSARRSICASNTLKAEREDVLPKLEHLNAEPTRWSPIGLRIRLSADAKSPAIHAEPAFRKGEIEIQDEGSQLAALFAGAKPGEQVIDLAAGAGGKTLALAAAMENRGQIYATDIDKRQLAPIHERIARAGARNIQVRTPRGEADAVVRSRRPRRSGADRCALHRHRHLAAQSRRQMACPAGRARRAGEAAGRTARSRRNTHQARGRIAYITCSVLEEENGDQVRGFVGRCPGFSVEKPAEVAQALGERAYLFMPSRAYLRRRIADDAAPDRYRRVFRQPAAALS